MIFMEAIAIAIVVFAVAMGISWVVRSVANTQIKLDNAKVKNKIEADLLKGFDEIRPPSKNRDGQSQ